MAVAASTVGRTDVTKCDAESPEVAVWHLAQGEREGIGNIERIGARTVQGVEGLEDVARGDEERASPIEEHAGAKHRRRGRKRLERDGPHHTPSAMPLANVSTRGPTTMVVEGLEMRHSQASAGSDEDRRTSGRKARRGWNREDRETPRRPAQRLIWPAAARKEPSDARIRNHGRRPVAAHGARIARRGSCGARPTLTALPRGSCGARPTLTAPPRGS